MRGFKKSHLEIESRKVLLFLTIEQVLNKHFYPGTLRYIKLKSTIREADATGLDENGSQPTYSQICEAPHTMRRVSASTTIPN
jgi:hypothetical protein